MQALVLIGGFGTRLRPLTYHVPKALVPIANVPFIKRFVDYLEANGINHIIFASGYFPDAIQNYLKNCDIKAKMDFIVEDIPLDTGGAIKNIEPLLDDRFFVFNGDILTTIPFQELLHAHQQKKAIVTIALTPVDDPSRYGVVVTDGDWRVQSFIEKPPKELTPSNFINAGIYLYEKTVLKYIPPKQRYSVERDLYPHLLQLNAPFYAVAFSNDYWIDIGKIDHYLQANLDVLSQKSSFPIYFKEIRTGIWLGEGVTISNNAHLNPPVLLNDGCIVETGATVGPLAILGKGVTVKQKAIVQEAVVWDDCVIGEGAVVKRCVLGNRCSVAPKVVLEQGSAYGMGSYIIQNNKTNQTQNLNSDL